MDVEGFLHEIVSFWKDLDWPDKEEAFGYGSQHLKVMINVKMIVSGSIYKQNLKLECEMFCFFLCMPITF